MGDIVRTLAPDDVLLAVWCNECLRSFRSGDTVVIEYGKAARHVVCSEARREPGAEHR